MTTIEEALVAHLRWYDAEVKTLVGQVRMYPSLIPEEITAPALAYELTAQNQGMTQSGPDGLFVSVLAIYCVSLGAWTYATAKALAEAVQDAVEYPTHVWGSIQVARVDTEISGGVWDQDTQDWMVTVTVTVNHMG